MKCIVEIHVLVKHMQKVEVNKNYSAHGKTR